MGSLRALRAELEEQKDRLLALQNTLVEIEPEIQKIDSYFVDPEEVIVFINDVSRQFFFCDFTKGAFFVFHRVISNIQILNQYTNYEFSVKFSHL